MFSASPERSRLSARTIFFMAAFALLLTLLLGAPLSSGRLFFVDDHVLPAARDFFARHGGNVFSAFFDTLAQTEIAHLFSASRYRPVYQILTISGAVILGPNAGAWFALNAALLFTGLLFWGLALKRFFSLPVALLAMTSLCCLSFHPDLWPRLGPSERYAFTFFMIFFFALTRADKGAGAWFVCCLTALLAAGSKENFLCLLLPLTIACAYRLAKGKSRTSTILFYLLALAGCAPVAFVVLKIMLFTGHDLYLESRDTPGLLRSMALYVKTYSMYIFSASFLLCFYALGLAKKEGDLSWEKQVRQCLYVLAVLFVIAIANFIFYKGSIRQFPRYQFPFTVMALLAVLCAGYALKPWLERCLRPRRKLTLLLYAALLTGCCVLIQFRNVPRIQAQISRTQAFQNCLDESRAYQKIYVINGNSITLSFEPYGAMRSYADAGLAPPVHYFPLYAESSSALEEQLEQQMRSITDKAPPAVIDSSVYLINFDQWQARAIEHSADLRPAASLLTAPHIGPEKNGDLRLKKDSILFFPVDDPGITALELEGDFAFLDSWQCRLNAMETNISEKNGRLVIAVGQEHQNAMPRHEQVYELAFSCRQEQNCAQMPLFFRQARIVR
ncbi:hypothetical protein LJC15_03210 [Desulfovibrio sp. OttesenSCG-928-G11]|nr:hypothetical protein [Desulfovibrio sp. OttesenSCG-928-G11]